MKVGVGCDHGGYDLKKEIIDFLNNQGYETVDLGCHTADSVDYPDLANATCQKVLGGDCERGILICGTGIGMSIAANRYKGIRAALCHEASSARLSREHNNANILCLGARIIGTALTMDIIKVFMETDFSGGRHLRRIELIG